MQPILIAIGIGFVLGFCKLIQGKALTYNNKLQTVWLLLLVFCMGNQIGRDQTLLQSLPTLGTQAALFALCTSVGSIAFVFVLSKVFLRPKEKGGKSL